MNSGYTRQMPHLRSFVRALLEVGTCDTGERTVLAHGERHDPRDRDVAGGVRLWTHPDSL